MRETPGAIAGVLSDEDGDAIDYVHDPAEIDDLDVQLLAAQVGQSLFRLEHTAQGFGLDNPLVVLETPKRGLVACSIGHAFVAAMLMDGHANVGRAIGAFTQGRIALAALLR